MNATTKSIITYETNHQLSKSRRQLIKPPAATEVGGKLVPLKLNVTNYRESKQLYRSTGFSAQSRTNNKRKEERGSNEESTRI